MAEETFKLSAMRGFEIEKLRRERQEAVERAATLGAEVVRLNEVVRVMDGVIRGGLALVDHLNARPEVMAECMRTWLDEANKLLAKLPQAPR